MTTANCPISLHKPNALSQNTSQIFECYFTILKRKLTSRAFLRHRKAQVFFQALLHYAKNCKPTFPFLPSLLDSEFFLLFPAELGRRSPRTTFVLQTYDFRAGAGADQGGSNLRRRHCESRRANHETTFKGYLRVATAREFARRHSERFRHARSPQRVCQGQDRFARDHSESDPTRAIPAEGSSGSRQLRTEPRRGQSDTRDPRRGCAKVKTDSHGTTARAIRHAGAPQRVRQGQDNSHGTTARALRHARSPQRVRQGQDRFARGHSESAWTRTISAEGSPRPRQIRTAPQRERFDAQDLRRGFAKVKTNSHGATARALRHARSPQRVRRDQDRFARRHSESASTRTIPAEGSSGSRQIRTAPQRERFDTHDLRRGFAALKTNLHGATARALRHARSPQRVHRAQDKFARRHSQSASTRTISAEGSPR